MEALEMIRLMISCEWMITDARKIMLYLARHSGTERRETAHQNTLTFRTNFLRKHLQDYSRFMLQYFVSARCQCNLDGNTQD